MLQWVEQVVEDRLQHVLQPASLQHDQDLEGAQVVEAFDWPLPKSLFPLDDLVRPAPD
jgi:hypothetical protein